MLRRTVISTLLVLVGSLLPAVAADAVPPSGSVWLCPPGTGAPPAFVGCTGPTDLATAVATTTVPFSELYLAHDFPHGALIIPGGFPDGVTISGEPSPLPTITGGASIGPTTGLTLENLHITGAQSNSVVRLAGVVRDFTLDSNVIDGAGVGGQHGISGGAFADSLTVTDNEFKDVYGWALLDTQSGCCTIPFSADNALTTVLFEGNSVHDVDGSVAIRGKIADRTDSVTVRNNMWTNINNNGSNPSNAWAAIEVNNADSVEITGNIVNDVAENSWGEGQAFQLWNLGSMDVHHNTLTDNFEGIALLFTDGFNGFSSPSGSIYRNVITWKGVPGVHGGTPYGIQTDVGVLGGPLDVACNWWGDASGPSGGGPGTGSAALGDLTFDPWLLSALLDQGCPPAPPPKGSAAAIVAPGGTVSTDVDGDGATPDSPVETSLTSPNGGAVFVTPGTTGGGASGYMLFGLELTIVAPPASAGDPLQIEFSVDPSAIPPGVDPSTVMVFRNGVAIPDCTGAPGVAAPDPCVSGRGTSGDDFTITVLTSTASQWQFGAVGTFTDDNGSPFEIDIQWIADKGITKGCGVGSYCPDDYVTRAQMAAFLVRSMGYTDAGLGNLFSDDDGSPFETDIDKLATAGVTNGCWSSLFCPDGYVTRGEMAAFLARALMLPAAATDFFSDDDGSMFEGDINRVAAAGITNGCVPGPIGLFCVDAYVTRAEMAAFLHRALG